MPNVHFLQADLRQLPFKRKFFDYIYSDQVLHHTKNTGTSFKYLTKFLTGSGHISIYVYNKKAPVREYVDDFIRKKTVKMSIEECTEFSKQILSHYSLIRRLTEHSFTDCSALYTGIS